MHLQSTYTPHLQHIQSEAHLESSRTSAVELYCGNSQRIKAVGYFRRRGPSWMFDRILMRPCPIIIFLYTKNWQHSPECLATFPEMFGDIPRNVWWHSLEFLIAFPGIFGDIPRNVWLHSLKYLMTFPGIFGNVPRNITFPHSPRSPHSVHRSCIPGFIHSQQIVLTLNVVPSM